MPNWKASVKIKETWCDQEPVNATACAAAAEICKRLADLPPGLRNSFEYSDIIDQLTDIAHSTDDPAGVDLVPEFDAILDELYDWGDRERVWLS